MFVTGIHGDKKLLIRQRMKTNRSFYQVRTPFSRLALTRLTHFIVGHVILNFLMCLDCKFVHLSLTVGYSTCHWCHVMERESFEDEEIGKIMSDNFVCIKLDREERPDVDKVYMTFVQVCEWVCLRLGIFTQAFFFFFSATPSSPLVTNVNRQQVEVEGGP